MHLFGIWLCFFSEFLMTLLYFYSANLQQFHAVNRTMGIKIQNLLRNSLVPMATHILCMCFVWDTPNCDCWLYFTSLIFWVFVLRQCFFSYALNWSQIIIWSCYVHGILPQNTNKRNWMLITGFGGKIYFLFMHAFCWIFVHVFGVVS